MRNLVIKWSNEASGIHGSEDGNIMYKPGYFWQLWSLHKGTPLSPKYSPPSSTARIVFCRAASAICMAIYPEAGDILYLLYPLKIVTSSNRYSNILPMLGPRMWRITVACFQYWPQIIDYCILHSIYTHTCPAAVMVSCSISWMIRLEKPGIVIQQHNTSSAASFMYLKSLKTSISGVSTFVQLYYSGPPTHFTNDSKTEVKLKLWLNC